MADDLTPFAFGEIYGTRSWLIDTEGYLTGMVFKRRWLPGENTAKCLSATEERVDPVTGRSFILHTRVGEDDPGRPIEPGHMLICGGGGVTAATSATRNQGFGGCGFHAYLEGSLDYHSTADASGIVALYGRGVRGTHGGRFVKARVVAIFAPRDLDALMADNQHHRRLYLPGASDEQLLRIDDAVRTKFAGVRSRYPGVPFYDTWDEMLQHHPTTAPSLPKEQS